MCKQEDIDHDCWINFETVDDTVKALREENQILRKVISQVATNLENGSTISEEASTQFMEELPKEVSLVIKQHTKIANNRKLILAMLNDLKNLV
jgi:hypothetical protein